MLSVVFYLWLYKKGLEIFSLKNLTSLRKKHFMIMISGVSLLKIIKTYPPTKKSIFNKCHENTNSLQSASFSFFLFRGVSAADGVSKARG